jgi:hypothetical protein
MPSSVSRRSSRRRPPRSSRRLGGLSRSGRRWRTSDALGGCRPAGGGLCRARGGRRRVRPGLGRRFRHSRQRCLLHSAIPNWRGATWPGVCGGLPAGRVAQHPLCHLEGRSLRNTPIAAIADAFQRLGWIWLTKNRIERSKYIRLADVIGPYQSGDLPIDSESRIAER